MEYVRGVFPPIHFSKIGLMAFLSFFSMSGVMKTTYEGTSQWLSSASLPLGFDPTITFDSTTAQLQLRDRLYLLSDGIYEAPSPTGELWGRDRLQATLETHRTHTLAHSIGEAMATARLWLGGDIFPDDVALLGVEVLDGSASATEKP